MVPNQSIYKNRILRRLYISLITCESHQLIRKGLEGTRPVIRHLNRFLGDSNSLDLSFGIKNGVTKWEETALNHIPLVIISYYILKKKKISIQVLLTNSKEIGEHETLK